MSKKSKSKKVQLQVQADQFKYKGMTKKQIQKEKRKERADWVGLRPAVFEDKRKKNDKKELKKHLTE